MRPLSAVSVARAMAKVDTSRARMIDAEREVAQALGDATETMSISDLAKLAGLPASDLRRIHREYADKANGDTHSPLPT